MIVAPSSLVTQLREWIREHTRDNPRPPREQISEATRQKMKDSHYLKNGGKHPLEGKNHSSESKEKMSFSKSKWWVKITDPAGSVIFCKSTNVAAKLANTNPDTIRIFSGKGPVPMPDPKYIKRGSQARVNAVGWAFERFLHDPEESSLSCP